MSEQEVRKPNGGKRILIEDTGCAVAHLEMSKETKVMERIYEPRRLIEAWQQVKRNAGAAGIDRMSVKEFDERKRELMPIIRNRLIDGTYRFEPALRVEIPKPGSTKKRKLRIPTVIMDRIVSTSVQRVFEEIFDSDFTSSNATSFPSSSGGRSQTSGW